MEEIENDKMIYWVIFFAFLIVVAVLGHHFVFKEAMEKSKEKDKKIVEEQINLNDYIGVWHFWLDGNKPLQEISINVIDGSTVTFDYYVDEVIAIESETASLIDEIASFNIKNDFGYIKGKIIFRSDKLFLTITSTDVEGLNSGNYEFLEKSNESYLK